MKKKALVSLVVLACLAAAGVLAFVFVPFRRGAGDKSVAGEQSLIASPRGGIESAEQTIERLKPQFNFSENESSGEYFCWHRLSKFQFIDTTTITAYIHHDLSGLNIVLTSTYIQKNRIFSSHEPFYDTILVKIGGETKKIVTYKDTGSAPHFAIGCETNNRFDDENKETLLRFIADNPNKDVKIQLGETGEKHNYTLQKEHQQAICQTVELHDALKTLERAKGSGVYSKGDHLKELFLNVQSNQTQPANAK